jgi:hypothetical protein
MARFSLALLSMTDAEGTTIVSCIVAGPFGVAIAHL